MDRPAGDEGMTTAQRNTSPGKRRHYYVARNLRPTQSGAVFVCDHAYDCDPLYREASEEEVVAHIGAELLRVAQDECGRNGLGSTCLMVYPVLDHETGEEFRVVKRCGKRWVLKGWARVTGENSIRRARIGRGTHEDTVGRGRGTQHESCLR